MKQTASLLSMMAIAVALLAIGCSEEPAAPIPEVSVEQVAQWLESGEAVAVDANGASTRAEHGVIPGARLLSSSGTYDPNAELPSDKSTQLVFYCANTSCRASDGAAARAREAGYENVKVMRAGIVGWLEAGRETTPAG